MPLPDPLDLRVANRLRLARRQKDIKLEDMARELKISPEKLALIEEGRVYISAGYLWQAAQCLGKSVDWFFED